MVASNVALSSFMDPMLSRSVANLDVLTLNVYVSFSFFEESNNSHNWSSVKSRNGLYVFNFEFVLSPILSTVLWVLVPMEFR